MCNFEQFCRIFTNNSSQKCLRGHSKRRVSRRCHFSASSAMPNFLLHRAWNGIVIKFIKCRYVWYVFSNYSSSGFWLLPFLIYGLASCSVFHMLIPGSLLGMWVRICSSFFGSDLGHFYTFLDEFENASSLLFIYFAGDFICILNRNCF